MSRENVELVRRLYDALSRRDSETVLGLYDPEVEWNASGTPAGEVMGQSVYRGHDGLRQAFREYYEAFDNFQHHCEEVIDGGDQVVTVVTDRGRGRSSGIEFERRQAGVWTIREGKIVEVVWFPSRDEALEAVRLRKWSLSQENVEIVRRLYDEFFSNPERMFDPAAIKYFDPEIEIRQSAFLVGTEGTFHGYEGVARAAREMMDVFRRLYFVPIRLIDSGDHVVATVEAHAYGKDSGVEVHETIAHLWTLRGGRVVSWHVYWDPSQAHEAVGLRD